MLNGTPLRAHGEAQGALSALARWLQSHRADGTLSREE